MKLLKNVGYIFKFKYSYVPHDLVIKQDFAAQSQSHNASAVMLLSVCYSDYTNSTYMFQSHPGTRTIAVDLYNEKESLQPLWKQVEGFTKAIYPIMQSSPDGVHLICYSQG